MKRTINRFAADDLAEAVRFYKREAGVGLARRFLSEFERVVSLLEQHPGLGKPTNDGRRTHPLNDATVRDAHIKLVQSTLERYSGLELAFVFGSVARGTVRDGSDLDIAVRAAQPLSFSQKMTLIGDLAEAMGRPVDLIDLRTVGEPLLGQILSHGCRLMAARKLMAGCLAAISSTALTFYPTRSSPLTSGGPLGSGCNPAQA